MAAQVGKQQQLVNAAENNDNAKEHSNNQENAKNGASFDGEQEAKLLDGLVITDNNNEEELEIRDLKTARKYNNSDDESNGKGNEEKKIFCGGISYDTTGEDLSKYFSQFGPVKEAQVKYDRMTGRSRGFAFVEFETVEGCKASLVHREQAIKGKQCEIKPAKTREIGYMNKKVFVGGLPGDFPEEELRKHFEQFGRVEDVEWPFDKASKTRKNFAFVVFQSEDSADRAAATTKQHFANQDTLFQCDVKKAVPQGKRPFGGLRLHNGGGGGMGGIGGMGGGLRNAFAGAAMLGTTGGNGGHGHAMHSMGHHQLPMYQNAAAAAWYQMNAAAWYNAAYNGGAAWYGTPAGSANTGNGSATQWYNHHTVGGNHNVATAQQCSTNYSA